MDNERKLSTISTYTSLIKDHQGGGFYVVPSGEIINTELDQTAIVSRKGFKKFEVSIYNQQKDIDEVSLIFLINPTDITIGQTFISGDSYTREGWVSTLWGRNQPTILGNGSTAGFYVGGLGLSSVYRSLSLSYRNFISILGMFKNNGYYFMGGEQNKDLFKKMKVDKGRVISVLDQIKVSYDGTEYLGSFSSLSVDDSVENPYRFTYNFEFIVSGLRGEPIEGHLKMEGPDGKSNAVNDIIVRTSGGMEYDEIISLDPSNIHFDLPPSLSDEEISFIKRGGDSSKDIPMPKGITKNPKEYIKWLQSNKDIADQYLSDPKNVCKKRKIVNKFFDSIKADEINKKVESFAKANGRGNYCFTDKETESIFMLESRFNPNGTWDKAPSATGALGPAQIQPSTYRRIFRNQKNKDLFIKYMGQFGYPATDCLSVLNTLDTEDQTNPINQTTLLHTDVEFNYIVHKFIGFEDGGYTSSSQAQRSTDVDRLAIVLTNYNSGTKYLQENIDYIKKETASYAKAGVYMQSVTTCP